MADGFVPPQGVRSNAARGLELRREFNRGGTLVGVARARSLSNGQAIPLETINRMVSYFARHEVDKKGKDWDNNSAGYIAWLLWGGDAGKTWANSISQRAKKKDKSMNTDIATAYAEIIKQEKQDDGTLLVYGKATDDSIDIDQQICDATWLEKAMPEWFKTGGNIREQHSNIAAGVAKELDLKPDGHYITTLIVDPVSVKKVETGVLKGFSIGIRAPRIVRDTKAANGRIIDGQIVEVSLVDRPANPNAKLMLAKSVDGETGLVQVEELTETLDTTHTVKGDTMENNVDDKAVGEVPSKEEALKALEELKSQLDDYVNMCKEAGYIEDEEKAEDDQKPVGESAEEETEEGSEPNAAEEEVEEAEGKKPIPNKSATAKCLECGCDQPSNAHGRTDVSTATIVSPDETPKSAEPVVPEPHIESYPGTQDNDDDEEDGLILNDKTINAILTKAVKSATDSVSNEIALLKSANEAAQVEVNKLQTELALANNKAVSGGPKRALIKNDNSFEEFSLIANTYLAKASATSDKTLQRGYKELADEFAAKAVKPTNN